MRVLLFFIIFASIFLFIYIFLRVRAKRNIQRATQALKEIAEEYKTTVKLYDNNSEVVSELYKVALKNRKHAEAFLYQYFWFELCLRYMIISGRLKNILLDLLRAVTSEKFFYPKPDIERIKRIPKMHMLVTEYCKIYGDESKKDLVFITKRRDFIIHRMMKKTVTKEEVEKCFEEFLQETVIPFKNFLQASSNITLERTKEITEKFNKVAPKGLTL